MREILFRGKRVDNGEWVEGNLVCGKHFVSVDNEDAVVIIPKDCIFYPRNEITDQYEVDPTTVGQYTGLTDKNGKQIFEGDIVKHDFGVDQIGVQYATVEYSDKYTAFLINPLHDWMFCAKNDCEVIGNIHDNPELLKGAQE